MISGGKTIRGTEIKIADEAGKESPERHLGEILVSGNFMLSGYYHR